MGDRRNPVIAPSDGSGPYLLGSKCTSCGEVFFLPRIGCPRCTGRRIEDVPLSRRGRLYTYTIVYQRPVGYEGQMPYIVGKVELPEGAFVLAQMIGCSAEDLRTGMEMELAVRTLGQDENGDDVLGYAFKPA